MSECSNPFAVHDAPEMSKERGERILHLWFESKGEPWEAVQAIREYREMIDKEAECGHGGAGDVRDVLESR